MHVCEFACVWVGFICRCSFMCVHVKARGWYGESSSITLCLVFWGRVSHLGLELDHLASLASQLALESPCLHLQSSGMAGGPLTPASLSVVSGNLNCGPHTYVQKLYPWAISLALPTHPQGSFGIFLLWATVNSTCGLFESLLSSCLRYTGE